MKYVCKIFFNTNIFKKVWFINDCIINILEMFPQTLQMKTFEQNIPKMFQMLHNSLYRVLKINNAFPPLPSINGQ